LKTGPANYGAHNKWAKKANVWSRMRSAGPDPIMIRSQAGHENAQPSPARIPISQSLNPQQQTPKEKTQNEPKRNENPADFNRVAPLTTSYGL